ncbi:hypothetical protein GZ024_18585, partial [Klebsiella pneumoniae]|nr:hypothetical protein [Klebsiella pneumoniae]
ADRNRSHWSTSKTPSYTKSVSWQHHRKNEYHIDVQGGGSGTQLDRQLQDALEKFEREKRARQRASMNHDG